MAQPEASPQKKIEALTPEQEALMPVYAKTWTAIGLSTEPADRPRADNAIAKMYAQADMKVPPIVWTGSPLSNAIGRAILLAHGEAIWMAALKNAKKPTLKAIAKKLAPLMPKKNLDDLLQKLEASFVEIAETYNGTLLIAKAAAKRRIPDMENFLPV